MNIQILDLLVILTMTVGVPLCILLPQLGVSDLILFIFVPIGIIMCLIGIAASVIRLQVSGDKMKDTY